MTERIGLVLAGGSGKRMGRPKGALLVEGRPLAAHAAGLLALVCRRVVISLPPTGDNPVPDYPAVRDDEPAGRGPLAGIGAAFESGGDADLVVLACDYPQVTVALLQALLSADDGEHDLVLPADRRGRDHPLVAVWRSTCAPVVRDALDRSFFKVRGLLADLDVRRLHGRDFPQGDLERSLMNLNTPEDLEAMGVPFDLGGHRGDQRGGDQRGGQSPTDEAVSGGIDETDPPR